MDGDKATLEWVPLEITHGEKVYSQFLRKK
jgi:hypothetical protein